jgi:hypothetical protein
MKKLFTLIALLACFLGAKAVQIVDAEVSWAEAASIHFYSWGGQGTDKFDIQDGCLHFSQAEATDVPWGVQVFPIGDVEASEGVTYTLEMKIKGTGYQYLTHTDQESGEVIVDEPGSAIHNVNFQVGSANHDKYSAINVTEDFEVVTLDFDCTADGTGHILFQCGNWIGDLWIEYMKIYHEGKEVKEVEWKNILENGDAEGEYGEVPCAYSKEWGTDMTTLNDAAGGVMTPTPHVAPIEEDGSNKVFACHAKAVDPILLYAEDGSNGWSSWSAGDEMADNTWQNQFWINFPRAMKDGEQVKVSFKYKASKDCEVSTQDHQNTPGDYLGGGSVGTLNFTTEWQTFEKTYSAAANAHSIAFNVTGDNNAKTWMEDIDFYFDDLFVGNEVLEEGIFAAAINTNAEGAAYDYDSSVKFEEEEEGLFVGTVGTAGDQDSWVNQVMVSTARGTDKGFEASTLKVSGAVVSDPEVWMDYESAKKAKINFPEAGVWQISVDVNELKMNFIKIEGEEAKPKIDITANTTEVVVEGVARTANTWDNQFWIVANRDLEEGEETWMSFDYWLTSDEVEEAKVTAQYQGEPGDWAANGAISPDLVFTTQKQHWEGIITIPGNKTSNGKPIKSIAFNMSEIEEAANYYLTNVIWKLNDDTESLIDMEGTKPFWMSIGDGAPAVQFGADEPGNKGDLNGDGKINGTDIQALINAIVDEEEDLQFDINGDGKINGTDIQELINIILEQD